MLFKTFIIFLSILSVCNSLSFDFGDKRIKCYQKNERISCPEDLPQIICIKHEMWLCNTHNPSPEYFYQIKITTNGLKEFDLSGNLIKIHKPKYTAHVYIKLIFNNELTL